MTYKIKIEMEVTTKLSVNHITNYILGLLSSYQGTDYKSTVSIIDIRKKKIDLCTQKRQS